MGWSIHTISGTLYGAIDVGLFIMIIGGFLGISMKTGAIDAGIGAIVKRLGTRSTMLVVALMTVFAAGGTSYGMAEESLAFYFLIISAIIALGFDALTGVAVIMLGAGIGVMGSTINPFATGIASGFAGIPLGEGIIYRIIILVVGTAIGIWWVLRYAKRVQQDPSNSLVADMKADNERHFLRRDEGSETPELTGKRRLVLGLFGLAFVIMVYSVIPWSDLGLADPDAVLVVPGAGRPVPGLLDHHRPGAWDGRERAGRQLHRRRARPAGRGAGGRPGARYLGDHEQRPDHRHGSALHGNQPGRPAAGAVYQRRVPGLPAAVVPDPVVVRVWRR